MVEKSLGMNAKPMHITPKNVWLATIEKKGKIIDQGNSWYSILAVSIRKKTASIKHVLH